MRCPSCSERVTLNLKHSTATPCPRCGVGLLLPRESFASAALSAVIPISYAYRAYQYLRGTLYARTEDDLPAQAIARQPTTDDREDGED